MYWDVVKIDARKYSSFIVNGFSHEEPFNFTSENIAFGNSSISPGKWSRNDIENLLKNKLEFSVNGNMMIVKEDVDGPFLRTIGMKKPNEWFFVKMPEQPQKIILNFSFEEDACERPWHYPVPFNKEIVLKDDCYIWVSGDLNGTKINHPLQQFSVDIVKIPRVL